MATLATARGPSGILPLPSRTACDTVPGTLSTINANGTLTGTASKTTKSASMAAATSLPMVAGSKSVAAGATSMTIKSRIITESKSMAIGNASMTTGNETLAGSTSLLAVSGSGTGGGDQSLMTGGDTLGTSMLVHCGSIPAQTSVFTEGGKQSLNYGRIPVVAHVITDDDLGDLTGVRQPAFDIQRVIKLLTDPHSKMLYDRHVHALQKMARHYEKGFPMKELVQVFKILNVCADRVEGQPMYEEPIINILQLCALPYLQEKTSDRLIFQQIVVESISQLGYLMRIPFEAVRKQICLTLREFYNEASVEQNVVGHQPTSLSYNRKMVEQSDIAETLVKSMALMESSAELCLEVLKVLQDFSKHSEHNCIQMLKAEGAKRLCSRLTDSDPTGQILFRSVDVLWNLLEHGDKQLMAQQLNNLTCISQLRDAFICQLTHGYSHYDRQLRNDLLVIANIVASAEPHIPFVETGFVKQLCLFATFQEVKSHNPLVKQLKLQTNHEDFELRKLLVNILVLLSKDPTVINILSEGRLLLALFSFVRANEHTSAPQDWSCAQFEELQLHAMAALCSLCPLMLEDYMTCQGSTRCLLMLEWCLGPDSFGGQGNAFHGTGGRGNKKAQMRQCLRLIRSVVSTEDEVVLQDLVDQGGLNQLMGVLSTAFTRSAEAYDAVEIEMQADLLSILSCMCDSDLHRKELFGLQGVDLVVQYLKMDTRLLQSGLGHHKLLLAAIDCVWCAVVGCYLTEDYFLEKEGVFILIDLLEVSPKKMHNLILGCLLDLCENPKTINHLLTWRGRDGSTAPHLFCQMWRTEEAVMGCKRDANAAIADLDAPLMGEAQANGGVIPLRADQASLAIVDVSENLRAKLYALFCKIGFTELAGLDVTDHVTLTTVEKYLDFKLGEVWTETIKELEMENVRPVSPDAEAVEAIGRAVHERAQIVSGVQTELLEAQHNQDIMEEQEFYAEIRENHRQKEKRLTDFADYVARTSHFPVLKAAKERQDQAIEASRVQLKYRDVENFHDTELHSLHITAFCGKHVEVDSTWIAPPEHPELATYDPDNSGPPDDSGPPEVPLVKHLTM